MNIETLSRNSPNKRRGFMSKLKRLVSRESVDRTAFLHFSGMATLMFFCSISLLAIFHYIPRPENPEWAYLLGYAPLIPGAVAVFFAFRWYAQFDG